jgi:hypothetical protein
MGQFREQSNRWVSFPEHRWVISGERQSSLLNTFKELFAGDFKFLVKYSPENGRISIDPLGFHDF